MTIAAILSSKGNEVATVPAGTRVREAAVLLKERNIGAVQVVVRAVRVVLQREALEGLSDLFA